MTLNAMIALILFFFSPNSGKTVKGRGKWDGRVEEEGGEKKVTKIGQH